VKRQVSIKPLKLGAFYFNNMQMITKSPEETVKLGERMGKAATPGMVIALTGELGAGKTTLVQGIAKGLGVTDYVTSPSFVIISEFKGSIPLCHFDFYRLEGPSQIEELGIDEYFSRKDSVCVIEWAEKLGGLLPDSAAKVTIEIVSENERKFTVEGIDKI